MAPSVICHGLLPHLSSRTTHSHPNLNRVPPSMMMMT